MKISGKVTIKEAVIINASSRYLSIAINFVISAILARIIPPEEFGLMAVVTVFTTFFTILSDMGLSTAVIQNKTLNEADVKNIYSFSVYMSIALMLIFFIASNLIGSFYSNGELVIIGRWLSISVLFSSMNMVPNGVLYRDKRFGNLAVRNVVICIISAILALVIAFNGGGVYTLVAQSIISAVLTFAWSVIQTRVRFLPKFEFSSIKKIAGYAGYQYAFSILNYFARNLDNLLAGRFIGTTDLAYYNRAYGLMLYPVNNITGVISQVMHPVLADYQNDKEYIYSQYIKVLKVLMAISIFIETICIFSSTEIMILIYGSMWEGAVYSFKILSIAIITQMVTGTTGSVFQALGETKLLFISGAINIFITVVGIIIGIVAGDGIEILALFVALSYISHFFISYYAMMKYAFKRSYIKFLCEFKGEFLTIIVMGLAGVILPKLEMAYWASLAIKLLYFGIIFLGCLYITKDYKLIGMLRGKYDKKGN